MYNTPLDLSQPQMMPLAKAVNLGYPVYGVMPDDIDDYVIVQRTEKGLEVVQLVHRSINNWMKGRDRR